MVLQKSSTLHWSGNQAKTWALASAGDPDAYSLSYDSDDEVGHTPEPEASFSGRQEVRWQQRRGCSLLLSCFIAPPHLQGFADVQELPNTMGLFGK